MALDTADKRASAIGIGLAFVRVYPEPAAGDSQEDRQHWGMIYRGIAVGSELAESVYGPTRHPYHPFHPHHPTHY